MNIKLSEKHGVNPSMDCCFYCGKEIGIALMGKLKDDAEAPRRCCTSLEPCDECKEKYKDYCLLVEIADEKSMDVTGRWLGVKHEVLNGDFKTKPVAYCDAQTFAWLLEQGGYDEQE